MEVQRKHTSTTVEQENKYVSIKISIPPKRNNITNINAYRHIQICPNLSTHRSRKQSSTPNNSSENQKQNKYPKQ
jgi:hypothetical protein